MIDDEASRMIADCEVRESLLGDWERSFVDSLKRQLTNGRVLTYKQRSRLEQIWDRVTVRGVTR